MNYKYYVFYKPYNVLNQFTKEREDHVTLADFLSVEKDVYPVGRLDKDSEGLLLLTNDTTINDQLLNPNNKHRRTYIVQVENEITDNAISKLNKGVEIKLDAGLYHTKPCHVKKLNKAPVLPERDPPVRFRMNIPTSWAIIELSEGKNRQVRKMFASVGFPVLRLVRVQIEELKLGKLEPGKYYTIKLEELCSLLKIDIKTLIQKKSAIKNTFLNKNMESPEQTSSNKKAPKSAFNTYRDNRKKPK